MDKRDKIVLPSFIKNAKEISDYIHKDSPQNAAKFRSNLEDKIISVTQRPTSNPPEPNLPTKRNWYRFALVMKSWKMIFKVTNNLLVFIRIVHTHRHPGEIKKLRTNKYE
jgi:plasmid stabilization system protein ParE